MFEWFVHYALGNIPAWTWPALAAAGLTIFFMAGILSHLPQFKPWALFIKPVSLIACLFGVFMYGGQGVVAVYQADVKDAEHRAELADEKAKAANQALAASVANNAHLINGRAYGVKQIIIKDKDKINADCAKINHDAWEDYNRAIMNSGSKVTVTGAPK